VCSNLLSDEARAGFIDDVREEYVRVRAQHEGKKGLELVTLAQARANALKTDWTGYVPPKPEVTGTRILKNYDLAAIADYIDWGPFFQTWELSGPFPAILEDAVVGEAARNVYAEGRAMLKRIIEGRWLAASAVFGLFPAAMVDADDIEIYADEKRGKRLMTWHNLRQQNVKPAGRPNLCLADFVAPRGSGVADYLGAFAVTAGIGIEKKLAEFEKKHDDYGAIMLKALADRLAEAFTELLHQRVRREFWGYARDEKLDGAALIAEQYRGIRPAPGYPACPDHTPKGPLFELLKAGRIGMRLTESYAMHPAAAVSGFYFSHPESQYFAVGKVGRDQLEDYARRKGVALEEAERWLAPYLAYEPGRA
jgi:5-methyltetrahydrofolate--homocysteine methyltransferase